NLTTAIAPFAAMAAITVKRLPLASWRVVTILSPEMAVGSLPYGANARIGQVGPRRKFRSGSPIRTSSQDFRDAVPEARSCLKSPQLSGDHALCLQQCLYPVGDELDGKRGQ